MFSPEFKQGIISMSKEFDQKGGFVTCEVSIKEDLIPEFEQLVSEIGLIQLGRWIAMRCGTCVEHNGEEYIHLSIERPETIFKMAKAKNFIKIIG